MALLTGIAKWLGSARHEGPDARYRLGVSSNLFSGVLPEGVYYPDFTTLEDHRPLEFISLAGQALAKPWPRCTILDLGCGEGTSSVAIGRTGAHVIGIEGRPEVVARATYLRDRLGYTNVEFRTGSVLDPALWEKADAVFASGLIHHLDQPFRLMELIGEHCVDLAYFCTHLAPRDEAHRSASYFSTLLHHAGAMAFRGEELPGIRFVEGSSAAESEGQRRRHPRAGIGNLHSWWPAEESFVHAMGAAGFASYRRLAENDYRLRYRLCFRRAGEIGTGAPAEHALWDGPRRPAPDAAMARSLAADVIFLRANGISPAILGEEPIVDRVRRRLHEEGIPVSRSYLPGTGVTSALVRDGPPFVVLAADRLADLRKHLGDLVTLKSCQYAFTSFALPEIREFPALADPITGEPVADRFPSSIRY